MTEVKGYSNYLIYENGKVWSKIIKKFMKISIVDRNYGVVTLSNNGKRKRFYIHRLIGIHFIPNPNNYFSIDHIDRNPLNNNINNLRWADRKIQNTNKSYKNNTGHVFISKVKRKHGYLYEIRRGDYFHKRLSCNKWTLDEAVEIRDALIKKYCKDILNTNLICKKKFE